MDNMFTKLMNLDEKDFEKIEKEEKTLLKKLSAKKLHSFDNVAIDKDGNLYALEDMESGSDIIKNGYFYKRAERQISKGEKVE